MKKTIAIAPMLQFTNTHFRSFARILTKRAILYTEMIHMNAVIHSHEKLLPFEAVQHPITLQLGGSCPSKLFEAARVASSYHYDAINLNVGCPSDKVQQGCFGAVLMKNPYLVRECLQSISDGGKLPVSIKCRLGVDDFDTYQFLKHFVDVISDKGRGNFLHFIVHARKAYLKGLNPAQNRTVPPILYDRVIRLKSEYPNLCIEINGGINSFQDGWRLALEHNLDGYMIGRLAMSNPFQLLKIDSLLDEQPHQFSGINDSTLIRQQILMKYARYLQKLQRNQIKDECNRSIQPESQFLLFKPILNLYKGQPLGQKYRNKLSDLTTLKDNLPSEVVRDLADWITRQTYRLRQTQSELTVSQKLKYSAKA